MSALDIPVSFQTAVEHGAAVKALSLIGLTALLYDHILTLDLEVDLIWRCRPGFVSLIFLLNRYIVPCMLIVDTYEMAGVSSHSVLFCKIWTTVQSYLTLASFMSIHVLVAIRVFALHNGRSWIRKFLWCSGVLYLLSTMAVVTLGAIPVVATLQPSHGACVGMIPWYLWITWLPSVIFETILFILTLLALLNQERCRSFSRLTVILYRDGMIYFTAVTTCSSFCLLVWAFAPVTLIGLARYFALAAVNIVASRMVLNLKAFAASRRPAEDAQSTYRSRPFVSYAPERPQGRYLRQHSSLSPDPYIDLELYSIEREYQQLGTRLR